MHIYAVILHCDSFWRVHVVLPQVPFGEKSPDVRKGCVQALEHHRDAAAEEASQALWLAAFVEGHCGLHGRN